MHVCEVQIRYLVSLHLQMYFGKMHYRKTLNLVQKIVLPVFDSTLLYQTSILSNYDSNQSSKLIFMTLNLNCEIVCYTLFV